MSSPLNLYATRVFAEHPLSLWTLDENVGYISLLSQDQQNLSNWIVSGATVIDANGEFFSENPPQAPFSTYTSGLVEVAGNGGLINIQKSIPIADENINSDLGSFAISMYSFTYDRTVQARLGFSYIDTSNSQEYEVIRLVNIPANRSWAFVSETFGLPENYSSITPIIEFSYTETELSYEIAINGIAVGQWAEEFHTESLGISVEDLPANIPLVDKCIEALPYGLQGGSGYYLASENTLYAKNTGVPLVFGSSNATVIYPNNNGGPSLIVPGQGFLNKDGQYKPLTFEFWANIQSNALSPKRIVGPIGSDDGIYVDRHLMKLKIGSSIGYYSVKEWARPMLISIRLTYNSASLLVNGEEVVSLELDPNNTNYPPAFDGEDSLDWIGFYAHNDVPIMQIECVAIYPYEVPAIVHKRRFVYGQGVEFPISSKGLDNSTVVAIDYSVANYAKNVLYPQTNSWSSGFKENLESSSSSLSLPSYQPAKLYSNDFTEEQWLSANYELMSSLASNEIARFSLMPNLDYAETNSYLYLSKTSFLKESLKGFYGLFEVTDTTSKQTLLRFEQTSENSALHIFIENETLYYTISYLNASNVQQEDIFYSATGVTANDIFVAGLSLENAATNFGSRVASFLGTIQSSNLYIGGTKEFNNTFSGNILKIALLGSRNLQKTNNIFNSFGVPVDYSDGSLSSDSNKMTHISTYTLVPSININQFQLDVAVDSYWQDYVPLSYFGKYVKDYNGNDFFDLDFIQFNVDYVRLANFSNDSYDTSGLPIKTYVSFQYLADGANANPNYFTKTESLPKTGIVRPGSDWLTTRYEVLNDSVIKLPLGESIYSLAIVISIELVSDGIIKDSLSISSLELTSQVLGQTPNNIPTRFGPSIIPFKKSGLYFEYKNVEPFTIYKRESPYLYLTKNSGIRMRGNYDATDRNGLSIPINKSQSDFFKVNLFQMFLRYEEQDFPIAPSQIFEIQTATSLIKFFLVADSNTRKRGQIYAIDNSTGRLASGIVYYIDGKVVKRPILNLNVWSIIGMSFDSPQDFSSFTGALRFTSPILFNNVSYYQTTQLDDVQRFAFRKWSAVRSGIDNPLDWGYWAGKDQTPEGEVYTVSDGFTWQEVLFLTESEPTVPDASEVYNQYVGTNSYIFDTESSLRLFGYQASAYKDITWTTSTSTPV